MHAERVQVPAQARHLPSNIELPRRHFRSAFNLQRSEMLVNTEMTVGRVVIIAAIVFFTVEISTGQSVPDQIAAFCSMHP